LSEFESKVKLTIQLKRNYTSEDVAKLAGVSQSTVSRVFAGTTQVSEKKKKKILEAATKLQYRPNAHARSLTTRKSSMIGIIVRNIRNPFYSAVLEIFHRRLSALGYHLIFINSENEKIQDKEIGQLLDYRIQAVIITDALIASAAAEKLKQHGIAVFLFNRYTKHSNNTAVYCDNYLAARQIATYLIELGHKSFAFISGPPDTSTTVDRLKGFREILEKNKIKDFIVEPGHYTYESGYKLAQELMLRCKHIDCIFCGNDIIALGAMDAIRVMGYKIPEQVSVVGFDNIDMSDWPAYSLTTWEQPVEEMIEWVVRKISGDLDEKNNKGETIMMKGHLVIRNSVKSRK
jgi:DNA-binding LacI/PurR family transcriptional regulator